MVRVIWPLSSRSALSPHFFSFLSSLAISKSYLCDKYSISSVIISIFDEIKIHKVSIVVRIEIFASETVHDTALRSAYYIINRRIHAVP